jgi:hypothetical protein
VGEGGGRRKVSDGLSVWNGRRACGAAAGPTPAPATAPCPPPPPLTQLAAAARELLHLVEVATRPHHLPHDLAVAAALLALEQHLGGRAREARAVALERRQLAEALRDDLRVWEGGRKEEPCVGGRQSAEACLQGCRRLLLRLLAPALRCLPRAPPNPCSPHLRALLPLHQLLQRPQHLHKVVAPQHQARQLSVRLYRGDAAGKEDGGVHGAGKHSVRRGTPSRRLPVHWPLRQPSTAAGRRTPLPHPLAPPALTAARPPAARAPQRSPP